AGGVTDTDFTVQGKPRRRRADVRVEAEVRTVRGRLERIERPLLGGIGLAGADAHKQTLGCRAVGFDALLELPGRAESPRGTRVTQHCTQLFLLAPLSDRGQHSHPPMDLRPRPYPNRSCRARDNLACQINFR